MKLKVSVLVSFSILLSVFFLYCNSASAQTGNSVSGHVFGADRRPLSDVYVELLDDLSRAISRGRTSASGLYSFFGLSAGRFRIRVMPLGTDYEEQEQDLEIVNFSGSAGIGDTRVLGRVSEIRDFYLNPRRVAMGLGSPTSVFAQDVPDEARKLYRDAIDHLEDKKPQEAYTALKSALEIFPKYFVALETLGTEYVKAGHFEAAQILLSLAVEVNPRAYKSWYALARALEAQQKHGEALAAAKKAIQMNALAPESLFLTGYLLRQAKEYPEAEKQLIKARDTSGDSIPDVHWELALLYANGLKRYKDAAKELRLYLKAKPDDKNAENIKKLIAEFEEKAKTT
ncbi:MAG: tetratricopeptide repeat protein [Pyrinomonadaceae bacterium]